MQARSRGSHLGSRLSRKYSQVPSFSYFKRPNENQILTPDKLSQTKAPHFFAFGQTYISSVISPWFIPSDQKTTNQLSQVPSNTEWANHLTTLPNSTAQQTKLFQSKWSHMEK